MSSASAAFEFQPFEAPAAGYVETSPGVRVAQAADVLQQAHAEADAIREAARQEGFQAGFDAGLAQAHEQLEPIAAALVSAQSALGEERAKVADEVERHAVDLALQLAAKTLSATIAARPEHVVDVVRGSLRRLLERDHVIVMVSPDDLDLVRAAVEPLKAELGGIGSLDVQAERRVGRGGALVRTQAGEVDARLDQQLERAREVLLEALEGSGADDPADLSDQIFG